MKVRILALLVLLPLTVLPVCGVDISFSQADQVLESAQDYGVSTDGGLGQGVQNLLEAAVDQLGGLLRHSLGTALKLLAGVLLCGLAQGLEEDKPVGLGAVELAGALAITALTVSDMTTMVGLGRETISKMGDFADLILPAMATLTAATGAVPAAAERQRVTLLFSDLLITAVDSLLVPLVYAYIALSCAQAALGNGGLGKLAGLVRGTAVFFLTAMLLAFTGYLTASGAIAGSVDAAVVKTARMTISRAVPVVGGILSDAAESALASTSVLRGTVGVAGMLVVLAICLTPFLQLALHYLAYKLAAALAGTVDHSRLGALMDSIGGAFGLLLGMTGSCALMLLLSIVSAVSAVAPVSARGPSAGWRCGRRPSCVRSP